MTSLAVGLGMGLGVESRGPSFSPSQISGLVAWYQADDATATLNGSGVASLPDQSTTNHPLVQATGANQPQVVAAAQNNRRVIRFANASQTVLATSSNFTISGNSALSFVLAIKPTGDVTVATTNAVFGFGNNSASKALGLTGAALASSEFEMYIGGAASANTLRFTAPSYTAAAQLFTYTKASSGVLRIASAARRNGVALSQANSPIGTVSLNLAPLALGRFADLAANWFSGDFYELVVYNKVLSAAEIAAVETYVNSRWAIF